MAVLRLVADGHANRGIGAALRIAKAAVMSHVSTILVELGARDRAHAVTIGMQRGYLEPWRGGAGICMDTGAAPCSRLG